METYHSQEAGTPRQVVMFELAGETYGIGLEMVQEVIRMSRITRVPQTPEFVEGVINLRGYVIPVVDLKKRFGMGAVEETKSARIILVEACDQIIGISVDRVTDVVNVFDEDVEPPPPILSSTIQSDYLLGFTEIGEELVKLLDFERVFSQDELQRLRGLEDTDDDEMDLPEEI